MTPPMSETTLTVSPSPPDSQTVEAVQPGEGRPQFSFVVPCYNEAPNLAGTVAEIEQSACPAGLTSFELVMVDDGSRDGTAEAIHRLAESKPHVRPVVNERNLGLGGAYKRGVAAASGVHVMMVPGDNAHPAHGITPILAAVDSADMVIPYVTNPQVRGYSRRLASRGFVLVMNTIFGLRVPYYNGLVVHRLDLLREIEIETDSFAYQAEAIVKLLKRGAAFSTVGVEISTREHGSTKAFRVANVFSVLRALLDLKRRVG
jgi:glycosyltransferase involved in cell wall biosynthesis